MAPRPRPVPHPGVLLRAELDKQGVTQLALALAAGRPPQVISDIVTGKKVITADTALDLERVLGTDPLFWLHAQAAYELDRARQRRRGRGRGQRRA